MLTKRENFHRMMRHADPAWLPLAMLVTPPIADIMEQKLGTRDPAVAFDLDATEIFAGSGSDPELWRAAYRDFEIALPDNADVDGIGSVWLRPPADTLGKAYHLREMMHPLAAITSIEQLKKLPWPDPSDPKHYAQLPGLVAATRAADRAVFGAAACTQFEISWYVRGMDNLFFDLIEDNGIGDWLLDYFTERSIHTVTAYARAGVDVIGLGDDIGTQQGMMMSLDFWRTHLKPRLKRVIDAIRASQHEHVYVLYHSDGDIRAAIPELIEIGVDILNPMQPECMPLPTVIPEHRERVAYWGTIGIQTTMPFGTPADVRTAVAQCAAWIRDGARLVVAPTHVLEPDVPWENILALVEAVRATRLA